MVSALPELHADRRSTVPGLEGFATLTLTKTGDTAKAVITDGNKVLAEQDIEWTDFPLDEIELWTEYNGEFWVILLTSEH